ncbi:MAG: ferritin family protein [Candidatus Omnitrophota bacterium]|nr:ferritin family protein [Candidatus Omnitrophota bacterium]
MKIDYAKGQMAITDFDPLEAYKIARKIEKDGIEFYQKLQSQNFSPDITQALGFLLSEEKRHLRLFEDKISELRKNIEDGFEEEALVDFLDSKVFAPFDSLKNLDKYISDRLKVLKLGAAIEKNSISFYQACLNNLQAASAKRDLEFLLKEENAHLAILENLLSK